MWGLLNRTTNRDAYLPQRSEGFHVCAGAVAGITLAGRRFGHVELIDRGSEGGGRSGGGGSVHSKFRRRGALRGGYRP